MPEESSLEHLRGRIHPVLVTYLWKGEMTTDRLDVLEVGKAMTLVRIHHPGGGFSPRLLWNTALRSHRLTRARARQTPTKGRLITLEE